MREIISILSSSDQCNSLKVRIFVDFIKKVGSSLHKQADVSCRKKAPLGRSSVSGLHYVKKLPCLSKEMLLTCIFLQC